MADLMRLITSTARYADPSKCPPAMASFCGGQARVVGGVSRAYDYVRTAAATLGLCLCGLGMVAGAFVARHFMRKQEAEAAARAAAGAAPRDGAPPPVVGSRGTTNWLFWIFLGMGVTGVLCGAWGVVSLVRGRP